ncbi:MAG: class I SAM-dependent methyltransferase [Kiritimatiellia bacterium]|jgi:23S rRNA (cytosine1962-C5)-methyltransferase
MRAVEGERGYALLDSGCGRKLERFGEVVLSRPSAQAIWKPSLPERAWREADAAFDREEGNHWEGRSRLPDHWTIEETGIRFHLAVTDFGHLGIFPEQRAQWRWIHDTVGAACAKRRESCTVLNLFAYSGGSTMAAALAGASVCHLDASRGMVQWASDNAALNGISTVRWIVDDAHKFLAREVRRKRRYDAIILDPPTFGRGEGGEMYKIERDLPETLALCRTLLTDTPLFVLLSAHTPGLSPQVGGNLLSQALDGFAGEIETGEMLLTGGEGVLPLPSGTFARWRQP